MVYGNISWNWNHSHLLASSSMALGEWLTTLWYLYRIKMLGLDKASFSCKPVEKLLSLLLFLFKSKLSFTFQEIHTHTHTHTHSWPSTFKGQLNSQMQRSNSTRPFMRDLSITNGETTPYGYWEITVYICVYVCAHMCVCLCVHVCVCVCVCCACMHTKSLQPCPTLCNLMDCSLPGFSVQGILQARILVCIKYMGRHVCIIITNNLPISKVVSSHSNTAFGIRDAKGS